MSTLASVATPNGEKRTYVFYPEPSYTAEDFAHMAAILEDATLYGLAAVRLIHDDRITVTTIGTVCLS